MTIFGLVFLFAVAGRSDEALQRLDLHHARHGLDSACNLG